MREKFIESLIQLSRLYIRYSPVPYGKQAIFKAICWRSYEYDCQTVFGSRMRGNARDLVQGYIFYFGVWEPNLTSFVSRRLKGDQKRTFVDVGANVGYFSLLASKFLTEGRVVAIEAHPSIFKKLEENIKLNAESDIEAIHRAASDRAGMLNIFHAGSENEGATTTITNRFNDDSSLVEASTLDALLTDIDISAVKLIKIDVEGAEYEVLKGMEGTLSCLPDDAEVIVEITPSHEDPGRTQWIFDYFNSLGYFAYGLSNNYDPLFYINRFETEDPVRIVSYPENQIDVVFSKIRNHCL